MDEKITVRLPQMLVESLKKYSETNAITFSSALRRYLLIASYELQGGEEKEIFQELKRIESKLNRLSKSVEDLKVIHSGGVSK